MNIKLTNKRKKILDVLEQTHDALSAHDVHARVTDINLATVYRTLNDLHKESIITKMSFDGKTSLFEHTRDDHHHAVCSDCDEVIHFTLPAEEIKNMINIKDFDISEVEITVRGKHT